MYPPEFVRRSRELVKEGRERLGLSMGIVSHIADDRYEIVAVSSRQGVYVAGEAFPLRDTYCRDVYRRKETIALTELDGVHGLCRHPLYVAVPLEAYISSPIMVGDVVWGTLNFSCMVLRDEPFSADEIAWVEQGAAELSALLGATEDRQAG